MKRKKRKHQEHPTNAKRTIQKNNLDIENSKRTIQKSKFNNSDNGNSSGSIRSINKASKRNSIYQPQQKSQFHIKTNLRSNGSSKAVQINKVKEETNVSMSAWLKEKIRLHEDLVNYLLNLDIGIMTFYNPDERIYYSAFNKVIEFEEVNVIKKKKHIKEIFNEDIVMRRALFKGKEIEKFTNKEHQYFTNQHKGKNNDNKELKIKDWTLKFQMQDMLIGLMTRELRSQNNSQTFINMVMNVEDNINRHVVNSGGFFKMIFVSNTQINH